MVTFSTQFRYLKMQPNIFICKLVISRELVFHKIMLSELTVFVYQISERVQKLCFHLHITSQRHVKSSTLCLEFSTHGFNTTCIVSTLHHDIQQK